MVLSTLASSSGGTSSGNSCSGKAQGRTAHALKGQSCPAAGSARAPSPVSACPHPLTFEPVMMVMRVCAMNFLRCSESWSSPAPRGCRMRTPLLLTAGLLRMVVPAAAERRLATKSRVCFSCRRGWEEEESRGRVKWGKRKNKGTGGPAALQTKKHTFLKTALTVRLISVDNLLAFEHMARGMGNAAHEPGID